MIKKIFFLYLLINICLAKPPVTIDPKNPNDPPRLANGVEKKVLIIGIIKFI